MKLANKQRSKEEPVWIKIFIVFLSRLVISMIPSNLLGVSFIPVKPLPVFPKFIVQLHVLLAPWLMLLSFTTQSELLITTTSKTLKLWKGTDRFFEDEASAAHELLAELLAAPVGDIVSGDGESLAERDVIADLVHLSVDDPPLRLLFLLFERRRVGFGSPSRLTCLRSEELEKGGAVTERRWGGDEAFSDGEHICVFRQLGEWLSEREPSQVKRAETTYLGVYDLRIKPEPICLVWFETTKPKLISLSKNCFMNWLSPHLLLNFHTINVVNERKISIDFKY